MTDKNDTLVKQPIDRESVSSLSHDQSPKEESSSTVTSKVPSRADKFSARIKQYPKDELKLFSDGKSFIGSGGFGSVRKYHHKDKTVAVKEFAIKGDDEVITKILNMVQHEANTLCRFQHKNIVEILGIIHLENAVGIVLEYLDGGNLQNLVSADNPSGLSWSTRLEIARGITSGLRHIHNYGKNKTFCHGDLKSENVLLTNDLQVKLADFGSAAFFRATSASTTTINSVSSKQYTLSYVAPEFLEDTSQPKNPAMDMYSFALVLYELISRKEPYLDCAVPTAVPALILARIKPPDKFIGEAENQLECHHDRDAFRILKKLMEKCWNNNPASRPSSKSVEMALNQYLIKKQGSSSSDYKVKTFDAAAGANVEEIVRAPTVKTLTKQDENRSTSSSSTPPSFFGRDKTSIASDIVLPKQATTTLKNTLKQQGSSTVLGNNTSVRGSLDQYTNFLLNKNFDKAASVKSSLRSFIANGVNAKADDVMRFAAKLQEENKHLHSVAIFDTAAALYSKLTNPEEDLEKMQLCIQGMREANEAMKGDVNKKMIAIKHVIPLMRNWLRVMQSTSPTKVSEKWLCHSVSWAFANIEVCELWVDLWEERRRTLEEALSGMRKVFGRDVHKQHGRLFGTLLNNLGVVCNHESRIEDAAVLFQQSVDAHRKAEDYFGDEDERNGDIRKSESNLKSSRRIAWEKQMKRK